MDTYKRLSIKQWAVEDRPREKLLNKGTRSLSDSELIAILIRAGSINTSAVEIAKTILQAAENNLNELSKWSVADFLKFKGIGEAKAIAIVSALELGRRRKHAEVLEKPQINCARDLFEIMHPVVSDLAHEEFWAVYLNRANKIITKEHIGKGGIAGTVADPKLILKKGIELLASSILVCHNHPSGNPNPSHADRAITEKLSNAGNLLDLPLIDHIIIADTQYYSFADNGIL